MKLTKRNGIYLLDFRDALGKRQRKSLGTRDREEAERRAHDLMSGKDPRSDQWTLRHALEHTMRSVWQHQKSWRAMQSQVRLIAADLGHHPVAKVNYQLLTEYVYKLQDGGMKPGSINRRLASISKALSEAAKLGKLAAVPPMPKQPDPGKRVRFITPEEEQRLLVRCDCLIERDAVRMRHLIVFLVDTGARISEALNLKLENVTDQAVLFEDTKSTIDKPKHRRVPLTNRAAAAAGYLGMQIRLGTMPSRAQLQRQFGKVAKRAGLADVVFHTMRHTCASRLVQRGASIYEVREWLGHSSVKVTERYAHFADTSLSHLTSLLDDTDSVTLASGGHSATNVSQFPPRKPRPA